MPPRILEDHNHSDKQLFERTGSSVDVHRIVKSHARFCDAVVVNDWFAGKLNKHHNFSGNKPYLFKLQQWEWLKTNINN